MKIDKKKAVFISGMLLLVLAMLAYGILLLSEEPQKEPKENPEVPQLEEAPEDYESRLEAVEGVKEERERQITSVYDPELLDSSGRYDPYLEEQEKQRLMDSILASGPEPDYQGPPPSLTQSRKEPDSIPSTPGQIKSKQSLSLGSGHPEFFLSEASGSTVQAATGKGILAMVDGDQVIRQDQRLVLRLLEDGVLAGDSLKKHSRVYATCSFKANRLLLEIKAPFGRAGTLEGYDLSDGQPGIYVENSFRGEATREVLDDVIQDVNISGVPQVRGLKGLFQRDNRKVRVKVLHRYELILKPTL